MEQSAPESNCGVGGLTTWLASGERELPDRSPMQKQQRTRARGTADVEARTRGCCRHNDAVVSNGVSNRP
jgi:hypothetical protein